MSQSAMKIARKHNDRTCPYCGRLIWFNGESRQDFRIAAKAGSEVTNAMLDGMKASTDHVLPKSKIIGRTPAHKTLWNSVICCHDCNQKRGSKPLTSWLVAREQSGYGKNGAALYGALAEIHATAGYLENCFSPDYLRMIGKLK